MNLGMNLSPVVLVVLLAGAIVGGLLYRSWDKRQRVRKQADLDAERWRRLQYMLEALDGALDEFEAEVRPGVTPAALAEFLEELAHRRGVRSSVRNFRGFPAPACVAVNDVFLNAIPSHTPIEAGDLVSVQFGVTDGFAYAHQAWAYSVGEPTPDQARLLQAGIEALSRATQVAKGTGSVGDISEAIHGVAHAHDCEPNRDFVGSGIWEGPFEPPEIPCYSPSEHSLKALRTGDVLLIQAILHAKEAEVEVLEDSWSVRSRDGAPAVAMSRMVLLNNDSATPLTAIRRTRVSDMPREGGEMA